MFSRKSIRRIAGAVAGLVLLLGAVGVWKFWHPPVRALIAEKLPAITPSPFQNTKPGVAYIGAAACAVCHPDAEASYAKTAHSRALAEVDLLQEPPDGEFSDARTQKFYRIYRQENQLRHEESIRTATGTKLVLTDLPIRYTIGSGRFSRSYLVDRGGFLFESPATWYAARSEWQLSPGFQNYNHGFERPAELRCVACHAGRVEPVENSPQRLQIHALAIDCERCHGPGASHAAKWQGMGSDSPAAASLEVDETIVNLRHLDRRHREDVCAQCHLHSAATVELQGRSLQDFRPGLALKDFVTHFGSQTPKQRMEVVGHVEQLRLSRCYQADATLTCTTCHDPHAAPPPDESRDIYRRKCLNCHAESACKVPLERRRHDHPDDNCVTCHMPRGATDIPHFAFTHHRIGIHPSVKSESQGNEASELVPLESVIWQPAGDQQRNLGLAYLQFSDAGGQAHAVSYRARALELLVGIKPQNPADADVEAALARLYWPENPARTLQHAHAAAAAPTTSPEAWATSCFMLGSTYYELNQPTQAQQWLERTTQLRPSAQVFMMFSDCLRHAGDREGALAAARMATQLAPDRPRYIQHLVELLQEGGLSGEAKAVGKRVAPLQHYRRQIGP